MSHLRTSRQFGFYKNEFSFLKVKQFYPLFQGQEAYLSLKSPSAPETWLLTITMEKLCNRNETSSQLECGITTKLGDSAVHRYFLDRAVFRSLFYCLCLKYIYLRL